MTHATHHVVRVDVVTSDGHLLNDIEAALPAADGTSVGPEYDGPQRTGPDAGGNLASDEERLRARVAFVDSDAGETAAADLFTALADYSLPADAIVQRYLSPTGGVTSEEVRKWHEAHAETDEEGNWLCGCGPGWDPTGHIIDEV